MNYANQRTQDFDHENSVVLEYSKLVDGVEMKGVVYHNGVCFFKGLPTPIEMTMSEAERQCFTIEPADKIYESHEGTLIRVFNINKKWYISTNRKLDALNSKWASRHETFGQYFVKAIQTFGKDEHNHFVASSAGAAHGEKKEHDRRFLASVFERNLSPENKYMFILKPSQEERIVCHAEPRPTIYHVGTFDKDDNICNDDVVIDGIVVERPIQRKFETFDELKSGMEQLNIHYHQGFLIVQQNKTYKIIHDKYKMLFDVRGNIPSLRFRYLQLRRYDCDNKITLHDFDEFVQLYDFNKDETDIENEIYALCEDLHQKYLTIYVDKNQTVLSDTEQLVLKNIVHRGYIDRRIKTTPSRINDLLTRADPPILNKLLNERKRLKHLTSQAN